MNTDMVQYYHQRAKEYDRLYTRPDRLEELTEAGKIISSLFNGKDVLEVACGTGYWTKVISEKCNAILATDINESVIDIARHRDYGNAAVSFKVANLFNLPNDGQWNALFAGFICSHIYLDELPHFFRTMHSLCSAEVTFVYMDNNYVEGDSLPLETIDNKGNTFQNRKLDDGSNHLILKNFLSENTLKNILDTENVVPRFYQLKHYWILSYQLIPNQLNY